MKGLPILQQQRPGEGMRDPEGTESNVGSRGLRSCEGLYLRTDPMLLLQLWQHSRVISSGVRVVEAQSVIHVVVPSTRN